MERQQDSLSFVLLSFLHCLWFPIHCFPGNRGPRMFHGGKKYTSKIQSRSTRQRHRKERSLLTRQARSIKLLSLVLVELDLKVYTGIWGQTRQTTSLTNLSPNSVWFSTRPTHDIMCVYMYGCPLNGGVWSAGWVSRIVLSEVTLLYIREDETCTGGINWGYRWNAQI